MLMYAQDYDEKFVFLYQSAGTPRTGLCQLIQPYINNFQVNDCPSSDGITTNNYLGHANVYDRPGFNFLERHNGTGNITFFDGHAKAMKRSELYRNGSNSPFFDYEN